MYKYIRFRSKVNDYRSYYIRYIYIGEWSYRAAEEESRSAGGAGGNDLIKYLIRKQFQFAFGIYSRAPRRIQCDDDVRGSRDGSLAQMSGKGCCACEEENAKSESSAEHNYAKRLGGV